MITQPILPPRAGYVEVEVDGKRFYKNVQTRLVIRPGEAERMVSPVPPTVSQLLGQQITEIHLAQIEQGQFVTNLQLQMMEANANV